jgi:hypothetical protein
MKTFIAIATAAMLSTAAVAGDDPKQHTAATFESLDKNADQQISRTEAAADKTVADKFASLDTNGDGYVSRSEFLAKRDKS